MVLVWGGGGVTIRLRMRRGPSHGSVLGTIRLQKSKWNHVFISTV